MYINEDDCLINTTNNDHLWNNSNIKYRIETKDDLVLNSTQLFFDFSNHFIKLSFYLGKVTQYLTKKVLKDDSEHIHYDENYSIFKTLNEKMKILYLEVPKQYYEFNNPELFKVLSCNFLCHHSNIILLNRGALFYAQKFGNTEVTNECKNNCIESAFAVTNYLKKSMPHFHYLVDPHIPFFIFNAITIHVNCSFNEIGKYSIDFLEHSKIGIDLLEMNSQYWSMSSVFLDIINTLQNFLFYQSSISNAFHWVVPHSVSYFDWYYSLQDSQSIAMSSN